MEWQGQPDIERICDAFTHFITMPNAIKVVEEEEAGQPTSYKPQQVKAGKGDN